MNILIHLLDLILEFLWLTSLNLSIKCLSFLGVGQGRGGRHTCPPTEGVLRWKYKYEGLEHAQPRSPDAPHSPISCICSLSGTLSFYSPLLQGWEPTSGGWSFGPGSLDPWERHISLSSWFHSLSTTCPLVWGVFSLQCSYIFIYTLGQWFERIIFRKNN